MYSYTWTANSWVRIFFLCGSFFIYLKVSEGLKKEATTFFPSPFTSNGVSIWSSYRIGWGKSPLIGRIFVFSFNPPPPFLIVHLTDYSLLIQWVSPWILYILATLHWYEISNYKYNNQYTELTGGTQSNIKIIYIILFCFLQISKTFLLRLD